MMYQNMGWLWAALISLMGAISPGSARSQEEVQGILPVELDVLFSTLPKEIEGWKLTKSKGLRTRQNWFESSVVREFEKEQTEDDDEPVSGKVSISLQDTGKFRGSDIGVFDDFSPEEVIEGGESFYIKKIPVIVLKGGKRMYPQFLLEERFILSISFTNVSRDQLGEWFKKVKIESLSTIGDGPVVELPGSFSKRSIDELMGIDQTSVVRIGEDEESNE